MIILSPRVRSNRSTGPADRSTVNFCHSLGVPRVSVSHLCLFTLHFLLNLSSAVNRSTRPADRSTLNFRH